MNGKRIRQALWCLVLFILLACLPIFPIDTAPVIPEPVFRLRLVSLARLFVRLFQVGVSYRWAWYTGVAVLVLVVAGITIGIYVSRKLAV